MGSDGAACALTSGGALYCWGHGAHIGDGDNTLETTPKLTATGFTWKQVSVGSGLSTCAVDTNDDAYCWGYQQYNALGNGVNSGNYLHTPQAVLGGHKWQMVSMGGRYNGSNHTAHACGITVAGDAYCWGNDSYGQQGNGAGSHNYATPGLVSGGHSWVMLSARVYQTCGVTSTGDGYCWGEGANGRLGNGSTGDMQEPSLISGGHSWSQIVTGEEFSCGLTTSQDAYCWGNGDKLGDGTSTQSSVPVAVVGGKKWLKLAAGSTHACGLDVTHRLYCWGQGSNGELGAEDGSTSSLVPRRVYGDDTYSDFAAAFGTTYGLTQ